VLFVPFDEFRRMVAESSGGLAPVYANECLVYFLENRAAHTAYQSDIILIGARGGRHHSPQEASR